MIHSFKQALGGPVDMDTGEAGRWKRTLPCLPPSAAASQPRFTPHSINQKPQTCISSTSDCSSAKDCGYSEDAEALLRLKDWVDQQSQGDWTRRKRGCSGSFLDFGKHLCFLTCSSVATSLETWAGRIFWFLELSRTRKKLNPVICLRWRRHGLLRGRDTISVSSLKVPYYTVSQQLHMGTPNKCVF